MNPVRAGVVIKASDYLHSSAVNYVGKQGLLEIELPSNPIIDPLKKGYNFEIDQW